MSTPGRPSAKDELHAPFRPRRARYVTTGLALGMVVLLSLMGGSYAVGRSSDPARAPPCRPSEHLGRRASR